MGVGQLSESDAVDALRLPFYSSSHPTGSHGWRNQFDLGNPDWKHLFDRSVVETVLALAGRGCLSLAPDDAAQQAEEKWGVQRG